MKIEVSENNNIILREIYNPIGIKTNDGETIILMMRDSGFEIFYENQFFEMKKGKVKSAIQIKKERDEENKLKSEDDIEQCLYDF